jgi:hypothetical protein
MSCNIFDNMMGIALKRIETDNGYVYKNELYCPPHHCISQIKTKYPIKISGNYYPLSGIKTIIVKLEKDNCEYIDLYFH